MVGDEFDRISPIAESLHDLRGLVLSSTLSLRLAVTHRGSTNALFSNQIVQSLVQDFQDHAPRRLP